MYLIMGKSKDLKSVVVIVVLLVINNISIIYNI